MSENRVVEPSILILDDELPALNYMHEVVEEVKSSLPLFQNFKVYSTHQYSEFMNYVRKYLPKIIFLDIQMPTHNGIEVAQQIRDDALNLGYTNEHLPFIIFSTAYENYGYNAFKVEAVDYILKPVDNDKINHVFNKIETSYGSILKEIIESVKVPSAGIDLDLPLKEVLYFKADMKYISVVTGKKEFLINTTLVNLEQQYPQFIKIHRAYLVNPAYISKFYRKDNHWFLALKNHEEHLPVSRRQKQDLEGKLDYKDFFESEF